MSPLPKHSMLPSPGHTSPCYNNTSPCTAEDAITASVESFIFTILWLLLTLLGFTIEHICLCGVVNSKWAKFALKILAFLGAAATAVTEIYLQHGKFWCAHGQGSTSTILDESKKITDKVVKAVIAVFMVLWQFDWVKSLLTKLGELVKLRLQRCCGQPERSSSSSSSGTPTPAGRSPSEGFELAELGDRNDLDDPRVSESRAALLGPRNRPTERGTDLFH